MPSMRRDFQGRYRSQYSNLQQKAEGLTPNQAPAPVQHRNLAATPPPPTKYPFHLGAKELDKVYASCTILGGEDYRWGKLDDDSDACVLKFHTSLEHESGCKLDQVTVKICFTEHGPNDDIGNTTLSILGPPCPTKTICGDLRQEHVVQKSILTPKIQIPGGGGELGGYERTHETDFVRSWEYSCNWRVDKHGKYTIVHWNWHADMADPEAHHVGPLYSGVVLRHSGTSFWVGCKIELKLSRSFSNHLKRLFARSKEGDDKHSFRQIPASPTDANLETVVKGLDEEISRLMGWKPKQEEIEVTI